MAKIGTIQLFGFIDSWGDNSAEEFTRRFEEASIGAESIHLLVHCYGGQVFEGNLIYNLIRNSKIPVDITIIGVAASMGSIIMLGGRTIKMSDNAYIMIHAPSASVDGTADDMTKAAKLLSSLEKTFVKVYKTRTGKTEDELKQWLVGQNWFSAEEALAEKLIDEIVDAIAPEVIVTSEDVKQNNPKAIYNRYAAILVDNNQSNNNKQKQQMDKNSLIAKFGLTGVTEKSTDAEIEAAIEAKLNAETTKRVALETQIAEQTKARIVTMVQAAVTAGKITEAQKATFETIGEKSGEEALKASLEAIKTVPSITSQLGKPGAITTPANRAEWDFDKWQKEDPKGLEALPYDELNVLYNAKYGVDAPKV